MRRWEGLTARFRDMGGERESDRTAGCLTVDGVFRR